MRRTDFAPDNQPCNQAGNKQQTCQQLRNTNLADQQRIGSQTFNDHPLESIPAKVHQEDFAVKTSVLFGIEVQQHKSQQAPDGLIQETWMYRCVRVNRHTKRRQRRDIIRIRQIRDNPGTGHSPGQIGVAAKSLTVNEVAPAANSLANQESQ